MNYNFENVLIAVGLFVALYAFAMARESGPMKVCTVCEHVGPSRMQTRGSMGVEVCLWLCFLLPGIVYSLWRRSTRAPVCRVCGSSALVPSNSWVGQRIINIQKRTKEVS